MHFLTPPTAQPKQSNPNVVGAGGMLGCGVGGVEWVSFHRGLFFLCALYGSVL